MVFSSAADLAAIAAAVGAAAAGCTTAGLDGEVGATADDVPFCDGESGGGFTGALGANNACQPTTTSNESTAASSARRSAESSFTAGGREGPAAQQAPQREPCSAAGAVQLDGLIRVARASGIELARRGHQRRQDALIDAQASEQELGHGASGALRAQGR